MMKQVRFRQTFILNYWVWLLAALAICWSLFTVEVAAQDPTATPGAGVPVAPTPGNSPADRFIDFRVDDDDIDEGECVEFSWVVRGDVDRIEFNQKDDNKDGVLVANLDDREECPTKDTDYELIVRWLNGNKATRDIEVTVHEGSGNDDNSDNDNSSDSNNNTAVDSGTNATVGVFVQVTPILITNTLFNIRVTPVPQSSEAIAAAAVPVAPGSAPAKPAGILSGINELPETGGRSARPRSETGFSAIGGWAILSGSVMFSLLLLKLGKPIRSKGR